MFMNQKRGEDISQDFWPYRALEKGIKICGYGIQKTKQKKYGHFQGIKE